MQAEEQLTRTSIWCFSEIVSELWILIGCSDMFLSGHSAHEWNVFSMVGHAYMNAYFKAEWNIYETLDHFS
jgi:hypothetical protein